jgi:hypothetical protein
VFHLNDEGYYAVLLAGGLIHGVTGEPQRIIQFKLEKRLFRAGGQRSLELIPWTPIRVSAVDAGMPVTTTLDTHQVSIEYRDGLITVSVDGRPEQSARDDTLTSGLVGLGVFGKGDAVFHDLVVQDLR